MLGAIIGDILGSIKENIPGLELRKKVTLTDDSWLTLAIMNWMLTLDYKKFNFLYEKGTLLETAEGIRFTNDLILEAKKNLIMWHDIVIKVSCDESKIPIFGVGFENWVNNEKKKTQDFKKHNGNTNGCLMRNSPIPFLGFKYKLKLEEVIYLSVICCEITHKNMESVNAIKIHTEIIYLCCKGEITKNNIKLIIKEKVNIKPLLNWIPTKGNNKFIWDAKTSLEIALSAIYYSNSFEETIDFCNKTNMDTDTYCSIAGPIAELLWGIEEKNKNISINIINNFSCKEEIFKLIKNTYTSTMQF